MAALSLGLRLGFTEGQSTASSLENAILDELLAAITDELDDNILDEGA